MNKTSSKRGRPSPAKRIVEWIGAAETAVPKATRPASVPCRQCRSQVWFDYGPAAFCAGCKRYIGRISRENRKEETCSSSNEASKK